MASSRFSDLVRKTLKLILIVGIASMISCTFTSGARAQALSSLRGHVFDPTGALIPGANLILSQGEHALTAQSGKEGSYTFTNVPTGAYTLTVTAEGFTTFSKTDISLNSGESLEVNVALKVAGEEQQVAVTDQNAGVGVDPSVNASAMVLRGKDLDALSDDPNEMLSQLQGLAGPGAGPNGGQIYIDGFTGGQLPPKSSIREIRINQNPFSAEFDRLGYGRIEIFTKPGTDKYHARVLENGSTSAWNTSNPLVSQQPSYYLPFFDATLSGPLAKTSSFSLDVLRYDIQGQGLSRYNRRT